MEPFCVPVCVGGLFHQQGFPDLSQREGPPHPTANYPAFSEEVYTITKE